MRKFRKIRALPSTSASKIEESRSHEHQAKDAPRQRHSMRIMASYYSAKFGSLKCPNCGHDMVKVELSPMFADGIPAFYCTNCKVVEPAI